MVTESTIKQLVKKGSGTNAVYSPVFFRLTLPADKVNFQSLIGQNDVTLYDQLYDQLKELIKSRNPTRRLSQSDYESLISTHLSGANIEEYGVWVYYPWSGKVVHLLDETEFIELRTAANRNKITSSEHRSLQAKKVGVIGLSVGQSVSVTLAMERSCGELRLADFDVLELNNLNRIRTGVHNLGLLKVYSVAREIAEIDPFFKVVCFPDGITEDNIHDFFTDGGKLDIVIDECDSVHVKILCRQKAKELHVPVLMEASDRGTLDIERFDLHPEMPIMHGWLEHLSIDFSVLKNLKTTEEKIPYILPISGLETLSSRMKASMVEIEQTLTTWPQLASAVTLGGAITTDTCRRIFLNQYTESGRYFIDLERLLPDLRPNKEFQIAVPPPPVTLEEMIALADIVIKDSKAGSIEVNSTLIHRLIEDAITAPTAGNNQPWKWLLRGNCLFLFHDKNRSFSFGDFEDIASYVGLGATIENVELSAYNNRIGTELLLFPIAGIKKLVAVVRFKEFSAAYNLYRPVELYKQINSRHTNRNLGSRIAIPDEIYDRLRSAVASIDGATLLIKNQPEDLDELAEILGASDRLRLLHPDGHYEFYNKELRWNAEHSRVTADGIDIATVDISPVEIVGLKMVRDPEVVQHLIDWNGGNGLKRSAKKAVASASSIGLLLLPEFTSENFFNGGRAMERLWLEATELNVSMQPMAASILHFARLNHGNGEGMADFMKQEFSELYQRFLKIFPEAHGKAHVFLCKFSIAEKPAVKSFRLPIEKVLCFSKDII